MWQSAISVSKQNKRRTCLRFKKFTHNITMSLQRTTIAAPVASATPKAKGAAPLRIEGDAAQRYAKALAAEKQAKLEKEQAAATLKEIGVPLYFRTAVQASAFGEAPSSIKVIDATESIINIAFKDVYSAVAPEVAESLFERITKADGTPADINDYVHEIPSAKFDASGFTNPDGSFKETEFKSFLDAVGTVAATLGIQNPLSIVNVVKPKTTFHGTRFKDFDVETQKTVSESLPNTVALSVTAVTDNVYAPAPAPAPEAALDAALEGASSAGRARAASRATRAPSRAARTAHARTAR